MWIHLTQDEVLRISKLLEQRAEEPCSTTKEREADSMLAKRLMDDMADRFDPENDFYKQLAWDAYQRDGETEIDDMSDGSALVSVSEDGGAYVMGWFWVYDSRLPEDEEEDEEEAESDMEVAK